MTKLEKAIKGLECCKYINKLDCDNCPYTYNARSDRCECTAEMAFDALELLKEQEQILVHSSDFYGVMYADCPKCHERIDSIVNKHFCGNCGQAIKWTETAEGGQG